MQLLTITQASELSGISTSTLYKLTSPKVAELPTYKIGTSSRINKADLEAWLQNHRRPSRSEIYNKARINYGKNN